MKDGIIRLAYVDFWKSFYNTNHFYLPVFLRQHFNIIEDEKNPDYVICSCFGNSFLHYDCPRIFYTGEAVTPNFRAFDYALAYDYLPEGKRYMRLPVYYLKPQAMQLAKTKHEWPDDFYYSKKKFCNFVVSNSGSLLPRDECFRQLDARKHVDSAGGWLNNMGNQRCQDKLSFLRDYKFSLTMENRQKNGYITEKILEAFAGGTIPIYYGGNGVEKDFNKKAFIDITDFPSFDDCIDYILYLDSDMDAYMKIIREPIWNPGQKDSFNYEDRLFRFFRAIFDNPVPVYYRNRFLDILRKRMPDMYRHR